MEKVLKGMRRHSEVRDERFSRDEEDGIDDTTAATMERSKCSRVELVKQRSAQLHDSQYRQDCSQSHSTSEDHASPTSVSM